MEKKLCAWNSDTKNLEIYKTIKIYKLKNSRIVYRNMFREKKKFIYLFAWEQMPRGQTKFIFDMRK